MTRANVIVKKDDNIVYLYRHNDGYLSGLGKDLKNAILDYYTDPLFGIVKINGIELTNDIHDDIDYLYTINIYPDNILFICEDKMRNEIVETVRL